LIKKYLFLSIILSFNYLNAMSLDTAIKLALKHNNELKKTYLDLEQSRLQKESIKVDRYGKVNIVASYEHYNNSRTLVPLPPMQMTSSPTAAYEIPTTKDMFSAGISYSVVLFDGNAQKNNYQISNLSQTTSFLKTKLAKEELVYNVKSLYVSILALQKQLIATKEYSYSQKRLFEQIKKQYELGSKSKLDLLKAKNAYISSKSNEDKIEVNIDILKTNLSKVLGGIKFDNAEDISVDMQKYKDFRTNVEQLKKFQIIKTKSKIASKKIDKLKSLYFPQVSLNSYFGYNFGPNDTTNTSPLTGKTYIERGDLNFKSNWQIGVNFKWNVFDFGYKDALLEKERVALQSMKIQEIQTKLEIEKNLKNAKNKLSLSKANFDSAKSEYELLDAIVKVEIVKYENGMITLDDLLLSKAKKNLAYMKLINSKYEYQKILDYIEYIYEKNGEIK